MKGLFYILIYFNVHFPNINIPCGSYIVPLYIGFRRLFPAECYLFWIEWKELTFLSLTLLCHGPSTCWAVCPSHVHHVVREHTFSYPNGDCTFISCKLIQRWELGNILGASWGIAHIFTSQQKAHPPSQWYVSSSIAEADLLSWLKDCTASQD